MLPLVLGPGPSLRSKSPTAMINETLCKILAYNITVLIHAMYEFGIHPAFLDAEPIERAVSLTEGVQSRMEW